MDKMGCEMAMLSKKGEDCCRKSRVVHFLSSSSSGSTHSSHIASCIFDRLLG